MSMRPSRALFFRRGLWLLVGLMLLAVQTGLPAHQDSHPLGQPDNACHYCMLGGHSPGMPAAALPPAPVLTAAAVPPPLSIRPAAAGVLRRPFSRAPPAVNA